MDVWVVADGGGSYKSRLNTFYDIYDFNNYNIIG